MWRECYILKIFILGEYDIIENKKSIFMKIVYYFWIFEIFSNFEMSRKIIKIKVIQDFKWLDLLKIPNENFVFFFRRFFNTILFKNLYSFLGFFIIEKFKLNI